MLKPIFLKHLKKNENGFTFIELLVATVMSLVILGLLAHIFRAQQKTFANQNIANQIQANGRAATEFIARSVQNAGFNVKRGTRFLAASDHYLTAVYDSNNDGVIQNDEVITFSLANVWNGTTDDNFSFTAFFDVNGNGKIDNSENPTVTVQMTTSGGPPFNLYKVVPNSDGTSVERNLVARNIDNLVLRYYDKDGKLLPNGTGVDIDTDDDGVPDSGNWTYTLPAAELNDIRKVEIDILARSKKENSRGVVNTGSYIPGSLAAVSSGNTTYSDKYLRESFTAQMAPRNLVMAPWGSVEILASPETVDCPNTATVTATLLDANGQPIPGSTINFTATGGTSVTKSPPSVTSDSNGQGTTVVSYDYSQPYLSSTVSGSALVDDGSGNLKPIFNAKAVNFTFGGQGFFDPFDGTQTQPWSPLVTGPDMFDITAEEFHSNQPQGTLAGALNGCSPWKDYTLQANIKQDFGTTFNAGDFFGFILRNQDENNYYWVRVEQNGAYELKIGKKVAGVDTTLGTPMDLSATPININFTDDTMYTMKVQVKNDEISAKIWEPADPNDPAADEPTSWQYVVTDTDFVTGQFGVLAQDSIFKFDNVGLTNPEQTT